MSVSVEVRAAVREDQDQVIRLWAAMLDELSAHAPDIGPSPDFADRVAADFADRVRDPGCHISVAVSSGSITGFAQAELWQLPPIYRGREEVFISEIYVDPEYRGQRIGRMLFDEVARWARESGSRAIRARTVASSDSSRAFWESVGAAQSAVDYVKDLESEERKSAEMDRRIGF